MSDASLPSRQHLRSQLLARRQQLDAATRLAAAQHLRRSLEQLPEFMVDERVAGYWAHAGELPLNLVVAALTQRGQGFYLPLIGSRRKLTFARWQTGEDVQANRFGIPEPVHPTNILPPPLLDLVLVPLIGFDRRGNRLGFGGGYYDTSFAFLNQGTRPATPILIGVGYAAQECDCLQTEPWDVRMDYIATERELIDCNP